MHILRNWSIVARTKKLSSHALMCVYRGVRAKQLLCAFLYEFKQLAPPNKPYMICISCIYTCRHYTLPFVSLLLYSVKIIVAKGNACMCVYNYYMRTKARQSKYLILRHFYSKIYEGRARDEAFSPLFFLLYKRLVTKILHSELDLVLFF